jgi:phosphate acyltransferase
MKIGLDIMGGDKAPEVTVLGAIQARAELPASCTLVLIGDEQVITSILKRENVDLSAFEIIHAPDIISYNDHPTRALAAKPESSIAIGFNLLKQGKIDAFAGAGNTGAMLVGSIYSVSTVPGVIRPCITSILPRPDGTMGILLDVGSNSDSKADVLYQWAILGSIYSEFVYGVKNPRVGLLSIGEEEEKGNILVQTAHKLMKGTTDFNFIGNVEGRDLFGSKVDVIVTDGFTGNILLKNIEGIYYTMKKRAIKDEYFDSWNYELYGGTPVLGINGNVVIGHGISNATAIKNMIKHAAQIVQAGLTQKIAEALSKVVITNG